MTLLLSQALRLGEFVGKPVYGKWLVKNTRGKFCGGCAVGRACYAAGFLPHKGESKEDEFDRLVTFFKNTWPWTDRPPIGVPDVLRALSYRYEGVRYTMQELAEWIETIEPQEENQVKTCNIRGTQTLHLSTLNPKETPCRTF